MSSWVRCECGELLHTNWGCGAGVYLLIREDDLDELSEETKRVLAEKLDAETIVANLITRIVLRGKTTVRCKTCERLIVFWDQKVNADPPVYYFPEPSEGKS